MKKRILSLLCVLMLCLGLLPVTALAAGEHGSHSDGWTELTADTTTLSGGSYYLSGDVEYTGAESITVSGEVILCLNGQVLDLNGQHISVGSGASLTLCDCSTGGVLTGGSGSNGGGVYVDGGGTFTMTGGSITGNTANAGGGVYVYKGGTFTMEGGSINNNTATSGGGGGVMLYEGTFTMTGGSITGNATNSVTFGFGGGVCLYGTFYLSGDAIIQGNTKAGTADNLYLGWQTINITGPLGKNAHIGVTAESVPRSFISGWSDNMAGENPADYFSSDSDSWSIGLNTAGEAVLGNQCTTITLNPNGGTLPEFSLVEGAALPIPTKTGYTFAGWYEKPELTGDPVTDVPTGSTVNMTFYAKWSPNTYNVTFDANGGSLSQTSAVTVAGKLTSLPTPTYDGYDFLGWYTDKDSGDRVTTDTVFTMDSIIYAHWQNIPVTSLELNKYSLTLQENGSDTLTATVDPADATNKSVNWASSDNNIATVSEDGTVTAINAGTATITATAADGSGISASCNLTVTHGNMIQTPKKDATCTVDGTEEYWTCEICGKHYKDESGTIPTTPEENKIPATGHNYGEPEWSWSEDGKTCTVTFTCANDKTHKETPEVKVTSAVKTPATCTEKGVTTYTAAVEFNGQTYTDTKDVADIPATNHSYGEPEWNWSEDGKTCTVTFTCANDETHKETPEVKVTSAVKTPATCTEKGVTTYTAVVEFNGKTYTDTKNLTDIPATGHSYGKPEWNWSEDGKTCTVTFTCANDKTHKETPEVKVASEVKTPATCTEAGVTTYTATVEFNGKTYANTKEVADIPATGHSYENGKCTVCGAIASDFKAVITAGANGTWQKGTKDGLSFTSNAAYKHFQKVQVDGKDLDASNYTVKEGSTIVTLKASYLETLSVGKHTLSIVSDTGTATTEFTVKAAASANNQKPLKATNITKGEATESVQTGDNTNMMLWIVLLIISASALGITAFGIRKKHTEK